MSVHVQRARLWWVLDTLTSVRPAIEGAVKELTILVKETAESPDGTIGEWRGVQLNALHTHLTRALGQLTELEPRDAEAPPAPVTMQQLPVSDESWAQL